MLSGADPEDFDYDDSIGQYLYKDDVNLRLIMNRPDEMEPFYEPWVSNFPDPNGYKQEVYLEYNGKRIKKFWFVYVANFHYCIPYPRSANDLRISPFQYHLARILNWPFGYEIEQGLTIAGITVDSTL